MFLYLPEDGKVPWTSSFRKAAIHRYKPISPSSGQTQFNHRTYHFLLYQITHLLVKEILQKIHLSTNSQVLTMAGSKITRRKCSTQWELRPQGNGICSKQSRL